MLNLIFGKSVVYDVVLGVIIVLLIILSLKYKWLRYIIFCALILCFLGSGIYSSLELYEYHKASGNVFGLLKNEKVEDEIVVVGYDYNLPEFKFIKTENYAEYLATYTSTEVLVLDENKDYKILVNDMPCQENEHSNDYIKATYNYRFYDESMKHLSGGTLKINFSLLKDSTIIELRTSYATVVEYWQHYFDKNGCKITIKILDKEEKTSEGFENNTN